MKYSWWPLVLLILPVLASVTLKKDLDSVFHDRRKTFQAKPMEEIEGGAAGERITLTTETKQYQVKRGDSWLSIARQHKVGDVEALRLHNGNPVDLRPGMTIEIPERLVERP